MSIWIWSIFILWGFRPADCEEGLYKKPGSEVVLYPDKTTGPIKNILWKQGDNFAMEYIGNNVLAYQHFKEGHGSLNIVNGAMTIKGLTSEDAGLYTVEINSEVNKQINLQVIDSVLKPNVSASCDGNSNFCDLTCEGDTVDAAPVSFLWIIGGTKPQEKGKTYRLTKDVMAEFIQCELENPVSSQQSDKFRNPLLSAEDSINPTGIIIRVVVVIALLVGIFLLSWILYRKGLIRIPCRGTRAAGHEVNQPRYEKAPGKDEDANNGPAVVTVQEPGTSPESTQRPNGTEAVPVEEPDASTEPNQRLDGTGVEVSADVHLNTSNDARPPHEGQTGSGHESGDAPTSSDNHRNADDSKSTDKPDDDKSALDKKPQEDEFKNTED